MCPRKAKEVETTISLASMGFSPYDAKKGEEFMNPAQRQHFQKILEHLKKTLMEQADLTMHHMQDESENLPDPNDRASKEENDYFELRTRDRERKLIRKIEQALERINHHDYGFCKSCGEEISIRRLEARPTAELCVDCKELDEIREKQQQGS